MLKFDIKKLAANCQMVKVCLENKGNDEDFLEKEFYNPKNFDALNILKTLCELSNTPVEIMITYFINVREPNPDFNKIKDNMELGACIGCNDADCPYECIFKNILDNPLTLAYKEKTTPIAFKNFPSEHFPAVLGSYINELAEAMVAPPQFIGTELLALLSALCSRFAYLQATPTWKIPLTGYYLVIGDVSTKKSPTMNAVLSLVNGHLRKDDRLIANDSTVEALEQLLLKHNSILLQADEAGIMETLGGYTKTNHASSSKLLSLYTCNPYRVDRKGQQPVFIQEPKLSILAGVQPSVLTQSRNLMTTGMLQRFIITFAERNKKYNGFSQKELSTELQNNMSNLIEELYERGQEGIVEKLTLSKEALQSLSFLQDELYTDIENTQSTSLQDYYGKYKEHVLKIAGLFHIVRMVTEGTQDTEITKETFEMAQEVSFYYCSISRDIFQNTTTEKPLDTEKGYRELLKKSQDGTFNPTFLNKCGIGGCDARKNGYTEQFIDRLLEQNRCIEIFNHGGKGRKFIIIKE